MVQERGEEKQKFYKGGGGKLGQGVGALKSGGEGGGLGLEPPYEL